LGIKVSRGYGGMIGILILAMITVLAGCESPTSSGGDGSGGETGTPGEGQLVVDSVGSFPLRYMYFDYLETMTEDDYTTIAVRLTSAELDESEVVPDGASSVYLELRSPTWPLEAGTYNHEEIDSFTTAEAMTFQGDVDWGDDDDALGSATVVTVSESDGVYTVSADFAGGFGSAGTFSLTATPTILGAPEGVTEPDPIEAGGPDTYQAEISGAVTGTITGTASLQANYNTIDGMYRFIFGIDDLTSEPSSYLAWSYEMDTYNSENDGLAEVEYPISGEIGGTISETDVARFWEGNRVVSVDGTRYRFAGSESNVGTLTLSTVSTTAVNGSFTLTGPFERYNETLEEWEDFGEVTVAVSFWLER
jgi:hypothetical protein